MKLIELCVVDGWCVIFVFLKQTVIASHPRHIPPVAMGNSSHSPAMTAMDNKAPNPLLGKRFKFLISDVVFRAVRFG